MIRVAAIMLCLSGPCVAQDRVSILMGSHHVGATVDFEETNPGIFLTWDRVTFGTYVNSYGRQSLAATYASPVLGGEDWSVELFAGAAYYPENGRGFAVHLGDVVPIGGLQIHYGNLFAQILPSDGKATDAILTVGITLDLSRPDGHFQGEKRPSDWFDDRHWPGAAELGP
jgi:hypothetical protein